MFLSDVEVGVDVLDVLNLNDEVLELGLILNWLDCLSMLGVVYEVVVILCCEVKYLLVNV